MTIASRPPAFLFTLLVAFLLSGCASQKEPTGLAEDVSVRRSQVVASSQSTVEGVLESNRQPRHADATTGHSASEDAVRPSPRDEVAAGSSPKPVTPRAVVPQPASPAPTAAGPVHAPVANRTGADTFWASFKAAIRSGSRSAIEAGVGETVRVNDESFARSSDDVQQFIDTLVENDAVRDATLAVDHLEHDSGFSMFEARVAYVFNGQRHEVPLAGRIEEVRPGDWRLVEVMVGL